LFIVHLSLINFVTIKDNNNNNNNNNSNNTNNNNKDLCTV